MQTLPTEAWRRTQEILAQSNGELRNGVDRPPTVGAAERIYPLRRFALQTAGVVALGLEALAAMLGPVLEVADASAGWLLSIALVPVEALTAIPYAGRFIGMLHRLILTVLWTALGLPDALLALLGVLPEKRLRLWIFMPLDEAGQPLWESEPLLEALAVAARILRREANIRLVPTGPLQFDYAFSPPEIMDDGWIRSGRVRVTSQELAVGCRLEALREDLGTVGARLAWWDLISHPRGSYRRLTGWGTPLMVMPVRAVEEGGLAGCSLGPLVDYLTVWAERPICLAHEIGHACNLLHQPGAMNLMNETCGGVHLNRWQVALLRLSRHVTYL